MKKVTLTSMLTICCITLFAQVKDTVIHQFKFGNEWVNQHLNILTYNQYCKVDEDFDQAWNMTANSWMNFSLTHYTYDNSGQTIASTLEVWDANLNNWRTSARSLFTYGTKGLNQVQINQIWDDAVKKWMDNSKYEQEFNNEGQTIEYIFYQYMDTGWQKYLRMLYSYDAYGRIEKTISQYWAENRWINNYKHENLYNEDQISKSYQWIDSTKRWQIVNRSFTDFVSNTTNIQSIHSQLFQNEEWVNLFRDKYRYSNNNSTIEYLEEEWQTGAWSNNAKVKMEYYPDGSFHSYSIEFWDRGTSSWNSGGRFIATHQSCYLIASLNSSQESQITDKQYEANRNFFDPLAGTHNNESQPIYHFKNLGEKESQNGYQLTLTAQPPHKNIASNASNNISAKQLSSFNISPNPAKNYFIITPHYSNQCNSIVLKISDISGRLIMQQKLQSSGAQRIGLSSIPNGIYLITVITGTSIQQGRLLIE